jgi:hypothetical protein
MDGEGSLFLETVFQGMFSGAVFGGIILVPMFLAGVYIGAISGIQYFRGGLDYATSATTLEGQTNTSSLDSTSVDFPNSKLIKTISVVRVANYIVLIGVIIGLITLIIALKTVRLAP